MAGKKGASWTTSRHKVRGRQDNINLYESFVSFAGNNGIRTDSPRHEPPFAESQHGAVSLPGRNGIAC